MRAEDEQHREYMAIIDKIIHLLCIIIHTPYKNRSKASLNEPSYEKKQHLSVSVHIVIR